MTSGDEVRQPLHFGEPPQVLMCSMYCTTIKIILLRIWFKRIPFFQGQQKTPRDISLCREEKEHHTELINVFRQV